MYFFRENHEVIPIRASSQTARFILLVADEPFMRISNSRLGIVHSALNMITPSFRACHISAAH